MTQGNILTTSGQERFLKQDTHTHTQNGTDEPICRAGIETETWGMDMWTQSRRSGGETNWEGGTDMYPRPCVE